MSTKLGKRAFWKLCVFTGAGLVFALTVGAGQGSKEETHRAAFAWDAPSGSTRSLWLEEGDAFEFLTSHQTVIV